MRKTSVLLFPVLFALSSPARADAVDAGSPAAEGRSGRAPDLSTKVTLTLKDASVKDTLQKLAEILGVTPIMGPDVAGRFSTRAIEIPISEVIHEIEEAFKLTIRIVDGKMLVSKATAGAPPPTDDSALERRYLEDRSLPRRAVGPLPKRDLQTFVLRMEGPGAEARSVTFSSPYVRASLPGCREPVGMMLLGTDLFDGRAWIAFAESEEVPGGRRLRGRIAMAASAKVPESTGPVRLPGCPLAFRLLEAGDLDLKETTISSVDSPQAYVVSVQLIEVDGKGETVLAAPRIASRGSVPWAIASGKQVPPFGGPKPLEAMTSLKGGLLEIDDAGALLALAVSITRDVDPGDGTGPVKILIARGAETLRVQFGKPERWTISPTYGLGHSALVAEVTLTKPAEKKAPKP